MAGTGNKLMNQLNIDDIEDNRAIKSESLKDTSINIHLRHLKAFLNKACESNYIYNKWYKRIKSKKLSEQRRIPIVREDISEIIEKAKEPVMKEIIMYGYITGSRRNEIINQTWENVNFDGMMITITISKNESFQTKSKKNRIIPINHIQAEMLREKFYRDQIINKREYVFRYNDIKINSNYATKYFKKIIRKNGFDNKITFHSLKHSFIINLINAGTDINTVKGISRAQQYNDNRAIHTYDQRDKKKGCGTALIE